MKTIIKYTFAGLLGVATLSACTDILDKSPLTEISQEDLLHLWRHTPTPCITR